MKDNKALIFNIIRGSFCDGYGSRTTVFLKGCPLRCLWCCNVEGQSLKNELKVTPSLCDGCGECAGSCPVDALCITGEKQLSVDRTLCTACGECAEYCYNEALALFAQPYTPEELYRLVSRDKIYYDRSGGGVTVGGGEATMQPDFLMEFMDLCQGNGIHTAIDTCGYTLTDKGFQCLARADLLLYDLKHMDSETHKKLTGVSNELILDNLRRLNNMHKSIIIRIPVIPGYNDSSENLHASAEFLAGLQSVERLDLIGYHNYSIRKYEQLGKVYPLNMPAASEPYMETIKEVFDQYGLKVQLGG